MGKHVNDFLDPFWIKAKLRAAENLTILINDLRCVQGCHNSIGNHIKNSRSSGILMLRPKRGNNDIGVYDRKNAHFDALALRSRRTAAISASISSDDNSPAEAALRARMADFASFL